jgi:RNA polymerase sigma-70 factor (sigma-E family)
MSGPGPEPARPRPRDEAVVALYHSHYVALVRTAVLLVGDVATAEDVVQDSFIAVYHAWWRLRDTGSALPYLRRAVMNRARSVLRQRAADRHAGGPAPDVASAEEDALATLARSSVLAALDALSPRQRQVIVLRYYADLSEAQIAGALGVTAGSVKVHATRALDSLRAALR